MFRTTLGLVLTGTFLISQTTGSQDDPIETKLRSAKAAFEKATTKARDGLLSELKKKSQNIQKSGDLKAVEKILAEIQAFEKKATLPTSVSTQLFAIEIRRARIKMQEDYNIAIKQYVVGGNIEKAKAIQLELDDFAVSNTFGVASDRKSDTTNDKTSAGKITTYLGHDGPVLSVCFAADGKSIFTGGQDKTIKSWDLLTGKCTGTVGGMLGRVMGLASVPVKVGTSAKKTVIAVASSRSEDGTFIWDPVTKSKSKGLPGVGHDSGPIAAAAKGRYVAGAHGSNTVEVWDLSNGMRIRSFDPTVRSRAVALTGDGKTLVTSGAEDAIRGYDVFSGKLLNQFAGNASPVTALAFHPDGKEFVAGSEDGAIRVFELKSGNVLRTLKGHAGGITGACVSPDGKLLITGGRDKTVRIWNYPTGEPLRKFQGHEKGVTAVAVSFNSTYAASASEDGSAILWGLPR